MVADLFDTLYTKMYLIDKRSHDTVLVYEIFLKDFLYQCLLHVIQKKLFRKIFLIFFFQSNDCYLSLFPSSFIS